MTPESPIETTDLEDEERRAPADRPPSAAAPAAAVEGTRIATLLLSDLVGSSALVERSGDAVAAALFQKHDRLARDLLEEHDGLEIDKTDGFLLLFDRPWQAVLYALDYHRALAELSQAEGVELASRVGIHLGEIVLRRNPPEDVARGAKPVEVEGLAKPTAARLMSLAGGRQTLMTQAAFDLARRSAIGSAREAESLRWLAHGSYLFKGIDEPVEVFEVGVDGAAPLAAPAGSEKVTRVADEDTILGWRPAPGLEIPYRPGWVVVEKLGEGGFGEVWLGEREKTGERRVFKFCYEAERLLSLQREITVFRLLKEELGLRDDIARILDWNLDEAPYFVEFVHIEGGTLTEWAEAQGGIDKLPLADRLEIVAQVATALAAAHSVGVLHKDVKPANVLIESDPQGRPRAVLIDFGIGLVTDRERLAAKGITVLGLTEMDLSTGGSAATGTQLYMAPELLAGQLSTIQADIFALGVMLYQVVVGDLNRPLAHGWKRHVEDELLREDIAKLIDGSPARRPGNAAEVAERLRTLEQRRAAREAEEQAAREAREAEEQAARAAERARRRRRVLTTVAAVSTVFLVVVSILAIQALRARADAERRRAQAEQLIDYMLTDLHEGLDKVGRLDLLEGVARSSQQYFDTLTEGDESTDALYQRGVALTYIGDVLLDRGDAQAAQAAYRDAIEIHQGALADDATSVAHRLGNVHGRQRLAEALASQGETATALESLERALAEAERLAADRPEDREPRFAIATLHYQIAVLQAQVGDQDAALASGLAAVEAIAPLAADAEQGHWRYPRLLIDAQLQVSSIHTFNNRKQEALAALEEARRVAERLVASDPENGTWPRRLAAVQEETGTVLYGLGRLEEALDSLRAAAATYRRLALTDPTRVTWRSHLARTVWVAGWILTDLERTDEAMRSFEEAQTNLEPLLEKDPRRIAWLSLAAYVHGAIARLDLQAGRASEAVASYASVVELRTRIAELSGDDPGPRNELAWSHLELGNAYAAQRETDRARREWRLAVEIVEPLTEALGVVSYLDTHAQALLQLGLVDEARPLVARLLDQNWDDPQFLALVESSGLSGD